jgi:hypothetical protein
VETHKVDVFFLTHAKNTNNLVEKVAGNDFDMGLDEWIAVF